MSGLTDSLNRLVSAMTTLQLAYRDAHWNVEGPNFIPLHDFFGNSYADISNTVDDVAERLRALSDYVTLNHNIVPLALAKRSSRDMLEHIRDQERLVGMIAKGTQTTAQEVQDEPTFDLMNDVVFASDKRVWMIESMLKNA